MESSVTEKTDGDVISARRYLITGIAIWFLHLNIVYGLPSLACKWGWLPFTVGGLSGTQVVQLILTVAGLAGVGLLVFWSWQIWRRFQREKSAQNPHLLEDTEKHHRPFMASLAMGANLFFFLALLTTLVPILTLAACRPG